MNGGAFKQCTAVFSDIFFQAWKTPVAHCLLTAFDLRTTCGDGGEERVGKGWGLM